MKTILTIIAIGGVCFLVGLITGKRHQEATLNSHIETVVALQEASVLSVDVHIANDLHNGRINEALNTLVIRIDSDMVNLANRQEGILNTVPALDFALNYRKTNSWMIVSDLVFRTRIQQLAVNLKTC